MLNVLLTQRRRKMTDAELNISDVTLIARLREPWDQRQSRRVAEEFEAADRIEALIEELDEAKALQFCGCSYDTPTDVCLGHHRLFERLYAVQRGKLEAKLAKAVEAADKMLDAFCVHEDSHQIAAYEAMCATLAEISSEAALNKGESHE
jgi:hypothetical protein